MQNPDKIDAIRRAAAFERTFGPILESGAHDHGCPKCGVPHHLKKLYCLGRQADARGGGPCSVEGEHLHALCTQCEFGWLEHTKDHRSLEP